MLTLQSRTKIMKAQKLEGMRNALSTQELAGGLPETCEGYKEKIKTKETRGKCRVWWKCWKS